MVLDTNVVSELMRPSPSPTVMQWVAAHDAAHLLVTAVGEAELRAGVAAMPPGRRRDGIAPAVEAMLTEDFAGRILAFDSQAERSHAAIVAARPRSGHPLAQFDGQIAAIARSRRMAVATRNTRDFEDTGVDLIDPWSIST